MLYIEYFVAVEVAQGAPAYKVFSCQVALRWSKERSVSHNAIKIYYVSMRPWLRQYRRPPSLVHDRETPHKIPHNTTSEYIINGTFIFCC